MRLGLVEGFYGRAWTWSQRARVVSALAKHGYRMHLYAPKADVTLRANWRHPLTDDWLSKVHAHQRVCADHGVGFGVGLSPEGFDPQSAIDRHDFESRLGELNALSLDALALLFDDPADRRPMSAMAQARLVDCAATRTNAGELYVCPTWYSNDPILATIYGAPPPDYLHQLGGAIDPAVNVFWAGEQICASGFESHELEIVADQLKRLPTLWDNYPVNDGPKMFGHLHLREPQSRTPGVLNGRIKAHFINPALQPTLTQIPAVALSALYQSVSCGQPLVGKDERFLSAARTCASDELARQMLDDLPSLQDVGLAQLDKSKTEMIQLYRAFSEPAAHEIVLWLNGFWEQPELQIDTQPGA